MTVYQKGKPVGVIQTGIEDIPRGQNAFTCVPPKGTDKPCTAPKKRGPKPSKTQGLLIALETPQERALRKALRPRSPTFNVPIATAADNAKTRAIAGRPIDARSQ